MPGSPALKTFHPSNYELLSSSYNMQIFAVREQLSPSTNMSPSVPSPPPPALQEVCLGIMANIACHSGQAAAMAGEPNLIPSVIAQLFQDDPPTLTEACRCAGRQSGMQAGYCQGHACCSRSCIHQNCLVFAGFIILRQ